jgi:hypothetical protein
MRGPWREAASPGVDKIALGMCAVDNVDPIFAGFGRVRVGGANSEEAHAPDAGAVLVLVVKIAALTTLCLAFG